MIEFDAVTLRAGPRVLIENLSFKAVDGQVVGVTGRNGVGKTTLLGAARGVIEPDAGRVLRHQDAPVAFVRQVQEVPDQSALEFTRHGDAILVDLERRLAAANTAGDGMALAALNDRYEAIDGYTATARAARILNGLGFGNDQIGDRVATFSGGWRVRLNLARALFAPSRILLLDEPTNHLDLDAIGWLERFLGHYQGVVLVVSHDREFLDNVCTHVLHVERAGAVLYRGDYTDAERQRAGHLARQAALRKRQQQEVARLTGFIDRFRAKASKARQAQSRIKALERLSQVAPAHVDSAFSFDFETPQHLPNPLLEFHSLAVGHDGGILLDDVTGRFRPGERIAVLGRNGAGKSTLLRVMAGIDRPLGGRMTPASTLAIGYFAQSTWEHLDTGRSPRSLLGEVRPELTDRAMAAFLGRFGYGGERADEPLAVRSGGEAARMALALVIAARPNLLLLDEPTNHLDIEMRHALTVALQSFEGCVVLVAHDRALLREVCDEIWLVDGGRVSGFDGDLDDYLGWLATPAATPGTDRGAGDSSRRDARREAARRRAELKPWRDEVSRLEREIKRLTEDLARTDRALADPGLYDGSDREKVVKLNREHAGCRKALDHVEQQWMDAVEQLEKLEAQQ